MARVGDAPFPALSSPPSTSQTKVKYFDCTIPQDSTTWIQSTPETIDQLSDEMVWKIFNQIITFSTRLTHNSLCHIRKIGLTSMKAAQLVLTYQASSRLFNSEMSKIPWLDYRTLQSFNRLPSEIVPLHVQPNLDHANDALTEAVLNDCLECFDLICSQHPTMRKSATNQFGWSLVALAAFSGSSRILERLLSTSHLEDSTVHLLISPGNAQFITPSPLEILVRNKDLHNLKIIFRLSGSRLHEFGNPRDNHNILSGLELELCTFVTPFVAEQLCKIGLPIYDFQNKYGDTSYHAGVHNEPAFLSWLRQRSSLSMSASNVENRTPWDCALKAKCIDSARWLAMNGAVQDGMAGYLIAEHTAIYNDNTLHAFIPSHGSPHLAFIDCVMMTRGLLEGLKTVVRITAPQENTNHVREMHETMAIQNCKLIWRASTEDSMSHMYLTDRKALDNPIYEVLTRTVAMARASGFLRFAQFISNPQLSFY
ncbi:hypothetical protein N7495_006673 [Penicillium taxi]|uniref:uncharacterized protein n=1 Tax=Penicillium taxi TaxID=168475 RepID=UPI0025453C9D|nr:uncharacterized protein N7495_006673 [Penicillium taxi]KAJ5894982.1 hypothetical protein N7495_006673 [Penicillium taxi]